jgi:hypothetical protein
MAFGIALFLTSADRTAGTNPVSTANAFTFPIDLGSIAIPTSGSTLSTPVHLYGKNTGTTTLAALTAQPTTATLAGHTDTSATIDLAPDASGSPGSWGADGASVTIVAGNIAPAATFDMWARADVASTATPAGTSANYPIFGVTLSFNDLG